MQLLEKLPFMITYTENQISAEEGVAAAATLVVLEWLIY